MTIYSWTDGHLALRERAYETRGRVELAPLAGWWPRTTGGDIVAIAAVFDDAVRTHGTPGVLRRWHFALRELERDGLRHPHALYTHNRSFWTLLESVVVFLDDVGAAPPHEHVWQALLAHLDRPTRNAGPSDDGPFGHFANIHTYDDLYRAQYAFLRDKRGSDVMAPPAGKGGGTIPIPRSTNDDVLQLATYWSNALAKTTPQMGHDEVVKRWTAALADVDKLAKPGKPDEVYGKNNDLWRDLQHVSTQVAIEDEAPTKTELATGAIKDSVTHLPENLAKAGHEGLALVEDGARAIGSAAKDVGKGLLEGLGAPVLVGAGLLGLFLVTRKRSRGGDE